MAKKIRYKKCRHRKGIILATSSDVEFIPDDEPFISGVVEPSGFESIRTYGVNIHYCPKCNEILDVTFDEIIADKK